MQSLILQYNVNALTNYAITKTNKLWLELKR